jgi:hypothetical protein
VPEDDSGVSPVVGMILVLGISVVGIAAVVYWGLPAIDEMKANVEFRTVEGQFNELDSTIKELVAGTTQRTAKRWQPSISRGEILIAENTQGWLFSVEKYDSGKRHAVLYTNLTDGDNEFVLKNDGDHALVDVKVEAYSIGASSETQLNVSLVGVNPWYVQMSGTNLASWTIGAEKQFKVSIRNVAPSDAAATIEDGIYRFKVYSGNTPIAEAWFMNTGAATYSLDAGLGNKAVVLNNGAVMTGSKDSVTIQNSPAIPPPITSGGGYRVFSRAIVFDGSAGFAGLDRFDVLLSLYAMSSLASYDCAEPTLSDCVQSAKIYVWGDYQAPWYAYLTRSSLGYNYVETTKTFSGYGGGSVKFLEDREEPSMAYTLLGSIIQVRA